MTEEERIAQIETAIEYLRLAQYSIKNAENSRGWQRNALTYTTKAEAILNRIHSLPQVRIMGVDQHAARAL